MISDSGSGGVSLDVAAILGAGNGRIETWKTLRSSTPLPSLRWKGLQNHVGENNCFLNSIVQVLWHLDPFRKSFSLVTCHACTERSCIFCALKVVFIQFQFSDRSTLPPDSLRRALAAAFEKRRRFQLGLMDDATECFEIILSWLHFHLVYNEPFDSCTASHCIPHSKFGMTLTEQAFCVLCGAKTQPLNFTELVHYVPTSAIVKQSKAPQNGSRITFGNLLRLALDAEVCCCPAGCGGVVQMQRTLMNSPDVVTVGLIWDSENANPRVIGQLTMTIDDLLKPSELFQSQLSVEFHLVGVVCFYSKHYSTFLLDRSQNTWALFDDATVVQIGSSWSDVADKICAGHFQPLLLFYENLNSQPISIATAPSKTWFVETPSDDFQVAGDSRADLRRRFPDYEGGNPSEARMQNLSSGTHEPPNWKGSEKSIPIPVSHSFPSRANVSEENSNKNIINASGESIQLCSCTSYSKKFTDSINDTSTDCDPDLSAPLCRSGQWSRSTMMDRRGQSELALNELCGLESPRLCCHDNKSRGYGKGDVRWRSHVTDKGSYSCSLGRLVPRRSELCPLLTSDFATRFSGPDSNFRNTGWNFPESTREKRSSFACSSQNSFTFDEFSSYSSDDQFFSLPASHVVNHFRESRPLSHILHPTAMLRRNRDYHTASRNSSPCENITGESEENYITSDAVKTVLESRGLKVNSAPGLRSGRVSGSTQFKTSEAVSANSIHDQTDGLSSLFETVSIKPDEKEGYESSEKFTGKSRFVELRLAGDLSGDPTPQKGHGDWKTCRKGILMKRGRKKKKRVSFSDNVALVLCAEDRPREPVNYVTYVRQMAAQNQDLRTSSLSSASSDSSSSSVSDSSSRSASSTLPEMPEILVGGLSAGKGALRLGEADETESEDDSCHTEGNVNGIESQNIRCNLCCRKWILAAESYCHDCSIYLSRLQHRN